MTRPGLALPMTGEDWRASRSHDLVIAVDGVRARMKTGRLRCIEPRGASDCADDPIIKPGYLPVGGVHAVLDATHLGRLLQGVL